MYNHPDMHRIRHDLRECFMAGIAAVQGEHCVAQFLSRQIQSNPVIQGDVYLIAIGKASISMTRGASQVLGGRLRRGLVISKQAAGPIVDSRIRVMQSAHPVPDERSLQAGAELMAFIASLPPAAPVLFLLSGGASALVEVLPDSLDAAQMTAVNQWLLGSGLAIADINAVRKRLSCVKGGRLARTLHGHPVICLAISDVPDDDTAVIGSGLLVADPALQHDLPFQVPDLVQHAMWQVPPAPLDTESCFDNIQFHIVAALLQAKQAAAARAMEMGFNATVHDRFIGGDALKQGEKLAQLLVEATPGMHIWGGETTIVLPPAPGRGGRNQSLALAAALALRGRDDVALLAAGTDGNDGPGDDAGAIIDGGSVDRGEQVLNLPARECLARADAGRLLAASGDLLHTGPTGTNVMDLIIGYRHDGDRRHGNNRFYRTGSRED